MLQVILLGVIHGIVFLPVLLSLFVRGSCLRVGKKAAVHPGPDASASSSRVFQLDSSARLLPTHHRPFPGQGGSPLSHHSAASLRPPPPLLALSASNPHLGPLRASSTPNGSGLEAPGAFAEPAPFGYALHHRRWVESP